MLLPIVLLLASAGPIQQTDKIVSSVEQSAKSQPRTFLPNPGPNKFVLGPHGNREMPDRGIIIPKGSSNTNRCLSITAYVFSDGENPTLKYVTDCPNLDIPYQTKRAHRDVPDTERQPSLKRTN